MLASERLEYIIKLVTLEKFVSVESLSQDLNVSGETIRRDLKLLENKRIVKRTYGGAYLEGGFDNDVNIQVRKSKFVENKKTIAQICSRFIQREDTIYLDSSTTSLEIAKLISQFPVTVITNSLLITNYLSKFEQVRTITIGGILDTVNLCFTGKTAISILDNYYAKKGFISCRSLSIKYGVMDSNEQIGHVRSKAIQNCNEPYLIVDHTKFDKTSLCKIADFEELKGIITDQAPPQHWIDYFHEKGIPVFSM